jgi:type IV secretory pathway VirJ component
MISLVLSLVLFPGITAMAVEETLQYGRFGKLTLYRNSSQPSHVVLFVSGDGGWNLGVVDMAQSLAGLDALVVGIDITHYLKELDRAEEKCTYPAADFENLSKFVQKKLGFDHYRLPVLVGYSSGATLVYALLAEAPPDTFQGAISMGFCPDLPLIKPFCAGYGLKSEPGPKGKGFNFLPAPKLKNHWIAFQGTIDQVCDANAVDAYVKQVGNAEIVSVPRVGHGFSVQKNWLPQFREAFLRMVKESRSMVTAAPPATTAIISDLPLVEIPAPDSTKDLLAVIISGDGGWASLDRDIGTSLAAKGIPVVGFNSLQYFWTPRNPGQASTDLERIVRYYLAAWHKQRVLLIGYSFGADVLPFMAGHLPDELRQRVSKVVLLGPGREASFEFHLSDWLGGRSEGALPVADELARLQGLKVLCLYGEDEKESLCREVPSAETNIKAISLGGGHHFGGDYARLADLIVSQIP